MAESPSSEAREILPEASREDSKERNTNNSFLDLKIKDVGYVWVIVFSMFVSNMLTVGYVKAFAVIYNAILDVYPDATGTMAGLMVGLLSGCRSIFSPAAGLISNVIGIRNTMLLGTTIYCVSLASSYFCTTVAQLTVSLGALIGLSHCLIENSHVILLPKFFESKLALANGVRTAGNPVGGMIYPLIVTSLFNFYGLKSLFIILSAITAHIYICIFLIRPFHTHVQIKVLDKMKQVYRSEQNNIGRELAPLWSSKNNNESNNKVLDKKAMKLNLYKEIMAQNTESCSRKKKKLIDITYFKNPHFLLFVGMAVGIPMGFPLGLYYIILYAKESVGLPPYEIAFLLTFHSALDFVLRITIGWLNSKNLYRKSKGFMFCLWISAAGVAMAIFSQTFWSLVVTVLLYTFGPASFQCFTNVILCEEFGKDNIASTWGFFRMSQGICSFIDSVLIGYLIDRCQSYVIPFIVMSIGIFICGFIMGIETIFKNYLSRTRQTVVTC